MTILTDYFSYYSFSLNLSIASLPYDGMAIVTAKAYETIFQFSYIRKAVGITLTRCVGDNSIKEHSVADVKIKTVSNIIYENITLHSL